MRYDVLDSWRGVCATIVALMHFNGLHHLWDLPLLRNAYLFVDFFFVLSGFVISHAYAARIESSSEALRFMVRRFGRVWPLPVPYFEDVVAVVYLISVFVMSALTYRLVEDPARRWFNGLSNRLVLRPVS